MSATDDAARGRVPGAESGRRLLRVLLSFTESRPLWTVADLAGELGLTPSMVYRYIALLREVGLVDGAEGRQYRVTDLAGSLAAAAAAGGVPVADAAAPVINRIRDEIGETVLVARRNGRLVFTVERAESNRPVRLQFEYGQAMPLHVGSLSRVLLAGMAPAERRGYLAHLSDEARALPQLQPEALAKVADDGFAESFEEVDEGIWGVAAPILDHDGVVVAAVGCAAPLYRTGPEERERIREAIVRGAVEISSAL